MAERDLLQDGQFLSVVCQICSSLPLEIQMISTSTTIEPVVTPFKAARLKAARLEALVQGRRLAAKLEILDLTDRMGINMLNGKFLALELD